MKKSFSVVFLILLVAMVFFPFSRNIVEILLALEVVFSIGILICKAVNKKFSAYPKVILYFTLASLGVNIALTRNVLIEVFEIPQKSALLYLAKNVFAKNYIAGFIVALLMFLVNVLIISKAAKRILKIVEERSNGINKVPTDYYVSLDGAIKFLKGNMTATIYICLVNIIVPLAIGIIKKQMLFQSAVAEFFPIVSVNIIAFSIPLLIVGVSALLEKEEN